LPVRELDLDRSVSREERRQRIARQIIWRRHRRHRRHALGHHPTRRKYLARMRRTLLHEQPLQQIGGTMALYQQLLLDTIMLEC